MLVDVVKIKVAAGNGGDGIVTFSKVKMTLGPTGGSGGRGGDVYLEAVPDLGALRKYRTQKDFHAEDGRAGRSAFRDGHRGEELVLQVPRGTVAHNCATGASFELTKVGERLLVASGGTGGKGNFLFRSATNTTPKRADPGLPGQTAEIELELKLIADVGLVGLPNVGKSSFLNAVTNAKSPVADYAFTTLEPHLGAFYGVIIADLPGLIEGASEGKGLGIKFLRHIERTRVLFHFITATSEDPLADYETIRAELGAYNKALLEKPEYVFVSKADDVSPERMKEIVKSLKKTKRAVTPLSVFDDASLEAAKAILKGIVI